MMHVDPSRLISEVPPLGSYIGAKVRSICDLYTKEQFFNQLYALQTSDWDDNHNRLKPSQKLKLTDG